MVKKIISGILNTFFISICIVALVFGVCFCMGIHPYIVQSGSMEPEIYTGSLVFVDTKYDYESLEIGNVIAFEPAKGTLVTHRIIDIENGLIETKGDNNDVSDGFSTSEENYRGLTKFAIPKIGYFFAWIQTKRGIILSVTIGIALLILDFAVSSNNKDEEKKTEHS